MKKKTVPLISNAKIAIVFFIFLAFIIGISLIFKTIAVVGASQFDDSKRFTLSISNGRSSEVMSLSPDPKSIAVFKLNTNTQPAEAGRLLEIPIDGYIAFDFLDLSQKSSSLFMNAIINYNKIKTNLTIIDLIKLAMLAKSIPESSIDARAVGDASELELDKIVDRLVRDSFIERDNQTIRIINGTEVNGLGSRLAKLITNMGGNVTFVMTEDSPRKKSVITYIDNKTYTVERLQEVLGYEVLKESSSAMSDITIIIGEDKLSSLSF